MLQRIDRAGRTLSQHLVVEPVLVDLVSETLDEGCMFGIGSRYVDPFIDVIVHGNRYRRGRGGQGLDSIDVYVVIRFVLVCERAEIRFVSGVNYALECG
jgi:hypothetical protein